MPRSFVTFRNHDFSAQFYKIWREKNVDERCDLLLLWSGSGWRTCTWSWPSSSSYSSQPSLLLSRYRAMFIWSPCFTKNIHSPYGEFSCQITIVLCVAYIYHIVFKSDKICKIYAILVIFTFLKRSRITFVDEFRGTKCWIKSTKFDYFRGEHNFDASETLICWI